MSQKMEAGVLTPEVEFPAQVILEKYRTCCAGFNEVERSIFEDWMIWEDRTIEQLAMREQLDPQEMKDRWRAFTQQLKDVFGTERSDLAIRKYMLLLVDLGDATKRGEITPEKRNLPGELPKGVVRFRSGESSFQLPVTEVMPVVTGNGKNKVIPFPTPKVAETTTSDHSFAIVSFQVNRSGHAS